MKTLWIHAGLPKNGSSALQVFFAKNRDKLLNEGIDYLDIADISKAIKGEISSGNAALFSRSLLHKNHPEYKSDDGSLYDKVINTVYKSDSANGLLSSEFFARVPLERFEGLKNELNNLNVTLKIIYYVRRQDQFLMSNYMQQVKRHKYIGSPGDFILNNYKKSPLLNYFDCANNLEKVLGARNVIPLIFESTKEHQKGLVGHFIETILGHCPNWINAQSLINTSLSPLELKLMLMANKYSPRMVFSDLIVANSINSGRVQKYSLHNIIPPNVIKEILEYFKEQNNDFEKKYGNGNVFPNHIDDNYVDLQSITFTPEEVMDILVGCMVSFDKRLSMLEK